MVQLNTLQIEILQAANGFSVAINRPHKHEGLPFDPIAFAKGVRAAQNVKDGDEWKALMEEPLMQVREKPQSELVVFASFEEMVDYLRQELHEE